MSKFAVIDTETTWDDAVMSIGMVIADTETFALVDKRYYILTPFKDHGGMYSDALYANGIEPDLGRAQGDGGFVNVLARSTKLGSYPRRSNVETPYQGRFK